MEDNLDLFSLYQRLLQYRIFLKSMIEGKREKDLMLLNEEQKAAMKEGEGLIKEVEKKIGELENVLGYRKSTPAA